MEANFQELDSIRQPINGYGDCASVLGSLHPSWSQNLQTRHGYSEQVVRPGARQQPSRLHLNLEGLTTALLQFEFCAATDH